MKYTIWKWILSCMIIAAPWCAAAVIEGSPKALFIVPALLAGHWLCLHFTAKDPGNANQSRKVMDMLLWIFPLISLFCALTFHWSVNGKDSSIILVSIDFFGILSLIIGNYLPKCRRNSTIGIKIKWTLENEENWNATHRFGGIVWVACGLGFFMLGCLPLKLTVPGVAVLVALMVILPTGYSYRYYRRQLAAGTYTKMPVQMPKLGKTGIAVLAVFIIGITVLMFTGTIKTQLSDTGLTVKPTYYPSVTVNYEDISQIELLQSYNGGIRTFGFSSARLSLGNYHSDQFGSYSRYTCNSCPSAIEIHAGERIYLISAPDEAQTKTLFNQLLPHIGR